VKRFHVTGEWIVEAKSATEAENFIENAVAADGTFVSDLEDCNAELEDLDEEDM
jgi:hypothetical protein